MCSLSAWSTDIFFNLERLTPPLHRKVESSAAQGGASQRHTYIGNKQVIPRNAYLLYLNQWGDVGQKHNKQLCWTPFAATFVVSQETTWRQQPQGRNELYAVLQRKESWKAQGPINYGLCVDFSGDYDFFFYKLLLPLMCRNGFNLGWFGEKKRWLGICSWHRSQR